MAIVILVYAEVGGCADTAGRESLKDHRRVKSRETRASHVFTNVNATKSEASRLAKSNHRKFLLQEV